jgi:hypothetical protein
VPVEVLAGTVVAHRGPGVGVTGSDLRVGSDRCVERVAEDAGGPTGLGEQAATGPSRPALLEQRRDRGFVQHWPARRRCHPRDEVRYDVRVQRRVVIGVWRG